MSDHVSTPWYSNGTAVYMGGDGGFSLRCCPSPEDNAKYIVKDVNYHERLVEVLRACVESLENKDETLGCIDNIVSDSAISLLIELDSEND